MRYLTLLILLSATPLSVSAVEPMEDALARLTRENEALTARVAKLEAALEKIQAQLGAAPGEGKVPPATPLAEAALSTDVPPKPPLVELYGFIEVDLTRDFNENDLGYPAGSSLKNRLFDVSAQPTRFGLRLNGPTIAGGVPTGKVEMDFNTGTGTETSPNLRMRHAFFRIDWPASGYGFLAGQTYDVIAPLQTDTISYPVENWTGDFGFRRPQVRLEKSFKLGESASLLFQGSLSKASSNVYVAPDGSATELVRIPVLQGRVAVDCPVFGGKSSTFGFYGHWGRDTYNITTTGANATLRTWSVGFDALVWFSPRFMLMVEGWRGKTMDTYLWWEGQHSSTMAEQDYFDNVITAGGWATLTYKHTPKLRFNIGSGFDNPLEQTSYVDEDEYSLTSFVNFFYDLDAHWEIGAELSNWLTKKESGEEEHKWRAQATFIYFF